MKREIESHEVGDRTEELLDKVEQGETIVITRRGEPLAKMVPHQPEAQVSDAPKPGDGP